MNSLFFRNTILHNYNYEVEIVIDIGTTSENVCEIYINDFYYAKTTGGAKRVFVQTIQVVTNTRKLKYELRNKPVNSSNSMFVYKYRRIGINP